MASMFFDENGNAVTFIINENEPGSYPIELEEFGNYPDISLWCLDSSTQLPRLKTAQELELTAERNFDNYKFMQALSVAFDPLELESFNQRFQTFNSYTMIENWPAIKQVLNNKIDNNIITIDEYDKLNNVFKQFGIDLNTL